MKRELRCRSVRSKRRESCLGRIQATEKQFTREMLRFAHCDVTFPGSSMEVFGMLGAKARGVGGRIIAGDLLRRKIAPRVTQFALGVRLLNQLPRPNTK